MSKQMVVWSETTFPGGQTFTGTLLQPKTVENYYNDICLLAFPTPLAEGPRMAECSPKFTSGPDRKSSDSGKLNDGDPGTVALLPLPEAGQPISLNIEFPEPFTAQALTVAP